METLPIETLILVLKNLNIKDLVSFSRVSSFYHTIASDDRLWKDLFFNQFIKSKQQSTAAAAAATPTATATTTISVSVAPIASTNDRPISPSTIQQISDTLIKDGIKSNGITPIKGWKHAYRKRIIMELSKKLVEYIQKGDVKMVDYLLSISLLTYNKTYSLASESSIKQKQPIILEKLLKFCSVDNYLDNLFNQSYSRLITLAVSSNSNQCARVLLDHGADITYSNTGVLLMGSKRRAFSLNGFFGSQHILFQMLCKDNIEMSYLFLDSMLAQITFFLCVQSGNELMLQDFLKNEKRGQTLVNKRTGIWDFGNEILKLSDHFSALSTHGGSYGSPRYTIRNQHLSGSGGSGGGGVDQIKIKEKYANMTRVRFTQYKMIEKTLLQFTSSWAPDWCSYTPLHWAAQGGHLGNIKTLLKLGANINTLTSSGKTLYDLAKEHGQTHCLPFLEKQMSRTIKISDFDPLLALIAQGNFFQVTRFINSFLFEKSVKGLDRAIVMRLIVHAIKHNQPRTLSSIFHALSVGHISDIDGNTPIHYAASAGHMECLQITVERGFVNKINKIRQSPLMLAIMNGHSATVQALLQQGASVETKDWLGNTALHYAPPYPDIVQLLLDHHADVSALNLQLRNPIHMASEVLCYESIDAKLESLEKMLAQITHSTMHQPTTQQQERMSQIINQPDIFGNTPLHLSQIHSRSSGSNNSNIITNTLLSFNASKDMVNLSQLSYKDMIVLNNEKQLVQLLKGDGSNTTPLKAPFAMEALIRLNFDVDYDTFVNLKRQNHLMLESYFKRSKSLTEMDKLMHFYSNDEASIQAILDTIKLYQLKSFFFDSLEKIIQGYIQVCRIDLALYILENLGAATNSPLYSQRFLAGVFDMLVHTPHIDLQTCARFVQLYVAVEKNPTIAELNKCLVLDNYNMFTAIVDALLASTEQLQQLFVKDKEEYFTLAVSYGSLDCLEYLLSLDHVYNIDQANEDDYSHNLVLLPKAINGLCFVKKRDQVLDILSRYDVCQIASLLKSLYTPSVDVYEPQQQIHSGASPVLVQSSLEDADIGDTQQDHSNNDTKIQCPDCRLFLLATDADDHKSVCTEGLYPCPNSIHCCSEKPMKKHRLLNHLQNHCLYLHCHQCDSMFSKSDFTQHLFTHEYYTWETCTLCTQMLSAFNTSYKDEIIHIKSSSSSSSNNNSNSKSNPNYSSEYKHLLTCKNHFVKCPSCRISFHITELKQHNCLCVNKLPVYRNLNFQNNDLVNLF